DELATMDWWHIVPFHPLAELEGPGFKIGAALPGFREVAFEREIRAAGGLIGKRIAQQAVRGERGKLEQAHRIRQTWIERWRIPGRGSREDPAAFRGFVTGRGPGGIGRWRVRQSA